MSDKDNFEFLLSQYLDGQLSQSDADKLKRQIAKDRDLAEQLRQYQSLESNLGALAVPELSELDYEAQRASIMSALERKVLLEGRRPRVLLLRPVFWGAVAAAAAIVLAVSLTWKTWMGDHSQGGPMLEQVAVRVLPEAPMSRGEAVVKVAVAARVVEEPTLPPVPPPLPERAPSGTVMVSIMPPAEKPDLDGNPNDIDFPI